MLKRIALSFDAARGFFFVDLPTKVLVPGTCLPLKAGLTSADGPLPPPAGTSLAAQAAAVLALNATVVVELPDDWFDERGDLLPAYFRSLYPQRYGKGQALPVFLAP